jgi:DNA-binding PadR family transcriptional regulator
MYRDNSLMPNEAIRLLALGILTEGERTYADLASAVRHFTERLVGPSLELIAQPLELLRVEGLVEAVDAKAPAESVCLRLTSAGKAALQTLLKSNLRPQINDLNKLIIALKIRFLHLLPEEEQRIQAELMMEILERDLARLQDLRDHHSADSGNLGAWLDLEVEQTRNRLAWYRGLAERLGI